MNINDILLNRLFIFLILLGYLEPVGISGLSSYNGGIWIIIHLFFNALKVLSIFLAFIVYISRPMMHRISKFMFVALLFSVLNIFEDILNANTNFMNTVIYVSSYLGLIAWIEIYSKKGYLIKFLKTMSFILSFIVLVNLLTIILYPYGIYVNRNGWTTNWLMGFKNNFIYMYIPLMCMKPMFEVMQKGRITIKTLLLLLIIGTSAYLVEADTSLVIVILYTLGLIFLLNREVFSKLKLRWIFAGSMVLSLLIIAFNFLGNFSTLLYNLFNKNETASNRILIWTEAIKNFSEHPLLGSGYSSVIDYAGMRFNMTHYHNKYLDILCIGGILLFVLWVLMILIADSYLDKRNINYRIKNILLLCGMAYGILYLMEAARDDVFFFMILAITYHANSLTLIEKRIK